MAPGANAYVSYQPPRSRPGALLTGAHTEGSQQRVLIQTQDQAVIFARLSSQRPVTELHLTIFKFRERRGRRIQDALACRRPRGVAPPACCEQAGYKKTAASGVDGVRHYASAASLKPPSTADTRSSVRSRS